MRFLIVEDTHRQHPHLTQEQLESIKPARGTKYSAGYDIAVAEDYILQPGEKKCFLIDYKIEIPGNMVAKLFERSSLHKRGLHLANTIGIIDADYCGNPDNDGNIGAVLVNTSDKPVELKFGERVAQIILEKYYVTVDDNATGSRNGGFGSTGVN